MKKLYSYFFIFLSMFSLQSCMQEFDLPLAKDGVIDLRHYAFSDNEFYSLRGQWEFYWNKQYFPKDFETATKENKSLPNKSFVEVPSVWPKLASTQNSRKGFATYRLKILLPQEPNNFSIRYLGLTTAGNIYINGSLIDTQGVFSTEEKNSTPKFHPDFFEIFPSQNRIVELIIQVSNYEQYWSGGISEVIYIGNRKSISTKTTQNYSFEIFLVGAFLIIAFYHLLLFIYNRDDLPMLLFALLALAAGLRIFTTGELLIAHIFPAIPYQIHVRIEYITWYFGASLFLHLIISLFGYTKYRFFVSFNYFISVALSLFALLTPVFIFTQTKVAFQIIFLVQMFSSFFFIVKAYRDKRYGIRLFLLATILLLITLVHDILNSSGPIKTGIYIAPLGMSLFFYALITILAYRFYDSFRRSVFLSDELQTKNMELLHINTLKDEFLIKTSSELKSPLKGILGMADSMLANAENISDADKQQLAMIYFSSTQMLYQINDSLDFSKNETNNIDLQITTINLSKVLFLTIAIWNANKKENVVLYNSVEKQYFIYADEQRLQQSIYNLVYVVQYYGDKKHIDISVQPENSVLHIHITSSSLSMATEDFDYSIDEASNESLKSSLFNLAVSKKLVEMQNGSLNLLKDAQEKIIGFQCTFPLSSDIPAETETDKDYSPISLVKNFENNIHVQSEVLKNTLFFQMEEGNDLSVLIVASDTLMTPIIESYLQILKIRSTFMETGEQGLKVLELDSSFDIVIVENTLPDMSGYELSKLIRKQYKLSELPILMITASDHHMDEILNIFENGANDYISKPFAKNEFLVRVNLLISYKIAMLEKEKITTMEKELSLAQKIQNSLLPKELPKIDSISFGTLYLPMSMVGGDYYDIKKISDTSFSVLVADVSGHGIPAALIASMLKISFQHNEKLLAQPANLLTALNNDLSGNLDNNFLTATYAYFDLQEKMVTITRAGHPPVLIKSRDSEEIAEIKPPGLIVGLDKGSVYKEEKVALKDGDRFLFYSDGITEINPAGSEDSDEKEEYGDGAFNEFIQLSASLGTNEFISLLVENLFDYSGLDSFNDDLTMVAVDYNLQ